MKLTFIGSGSAFSPMSAGNSNLLLEENGQKLCIDFGITAPYILRDEMGVDLSDVSGAFLTHNHFDHDGGLGFLAFYRYFVPNKEGKTVRPKLYIPSTLIGPLWDNCLKAGLDGIHGKQMHLQDYFEVISLPKNKSFCWEGIKFTPFQTVHVNMGNAIKPSYGLLIDNPKTGVKTLFSGDTNFSADSMSYLYEQCSVIYHDVECGPRSKIHAHIDDLRTLDPEIKKKMWLYHTTARPNCEGFLGFVEKGRSFTV